MRDAQSILDQMISFCGGEISEPDVLDVFGLVAADKIAELAGAVAAGDHRKIVAIVDECDANGRDLVRLLSDLQALVRGALLDAIAQGGRSEQLGGTPLTTEQLTRLLDGLREGEGGVKLGLAEKINFEVTLLNAVAQTRINHQTGLALQSHGNSQRLEQSQPHGAEARVLRDLAPARFAFLLQLLERGNHVCQQLHDDGRRNVRHDPQREDREPRQRPTREHVEKAQDPALLPFEQLLQLPRVDSRHRNVSANPVHHQGEQQKHQPATQVAKLAGLCNGCCASCHGPVLSRVRKSGDRAASRFDGGLRARRRTDTAELHGLADRTRFDHLDHFGQLTDQTRLLQHEHVHFGSSQLVERGQADLGIELQQVRFETTLRQTPLHGHLPAFETHLVVTTGTRLLAFVAATCGLSKTGANTATDAALRVFGAFCVFDSVEFHHGPLRVL